MVATGIVELIKDSLAFGCVSSDRSPSKVTNYSVMTFADAHYESFYNDFGPYNLSVLYRFCMKLLQKQKQVKRKPVLFCVRSDAQSRVNGAYLIGAFCIIYGSMSAEQVWALLKSNTSHFMPFRDAAMGTPSYDLSLLNTLRGVQRAVEHGWLDFSKFDCDEYEYYERVENGDFNWILPNKILAFCGPHNKAVTENGYPYHSPETYFSYFQQHNVSTIVRLNKKMYDARKFVDNGFEHIDLFFVDGSTPSDDIVLRFIHAVDHAQGPLAVHCKAGLGRTGTLIACWMMKEYGVTAPECMSWLRICRPGSVIGPQQQFLIDKQDWCWQLGNVKRNGHALHNLTSKVDHIQLLEQNKNKANARLPPTNTRGPQRPNILSKQTGTAAGSQGDHLLAIKAARQRAVSGGDSHPDMQSAANTPNGVLFTSPTTPIKPVRLDTMCGWYKNAAHKDKTTANAPKLGVRSLSFACAPAGPAIDTHAPAPKTARRRSSRSPAVAAAMDKDNKHSTRATKAVSFGVTSVLGPSTFAVPRTPTVTRAVVAPTVSRSPTVARAVAAPTVTRSPTVSRPVEIGGSQSTVGQSRSMCRTKSVSVYDMRTRVAVPAAKRPSGGRSSGQQPVKRSKSQSHLTSTNSRKIVLARRSK